MTVGQTGGELRSPATGWTRHDRVVLVEVEKIERLPEGAWLAHVRTSFGRLAAVRWCGDPAVRPGGSHVEWTIDEDIVWGRNAKLAVGSGPQMRSEGDRVVLRGRLSPFGDDGVVVLDLDRTPIMFDLAAPLPAGVAGSWVDIRVERENVALYPYEI